ncbi:type II toxin-antitoxin system RelE/ParE family toxin [Desulfococcaceae bacterium HSG8]|nr:type II toxin-antitoxin system RelE/ParE family toxin [Desulfococcaceae bacterium HSG8]
MEVRYRKSFLRDLKKLKKHTVYSKIFELAFTTLSEADGLRNVTDVKPMRGYPDRYRIRIGNYRVGIEVHNDNVEVMRALHRREFYRYFPD